MSRLIDADALIKCIPSEEIVSRIAVINAPTIEPRKGKWIYGSPVTMKCNQCGFYIPDWQWKDFNFCPNCGARMKEGDDHD